MSSQGNFPLGGSEVSKDRATATCYCGAVQLEFVRSMHHSDSKLTSQPTEGDGLIDTFVCHCTDCRKITASMFASNFIVKSSSVKHLRGEDKLSKFVQTKTIETGNSMASHFCSICGTLMYRISSGSFGRMVMRIGTVDDFGLHETKLKPRIEQFTRDRVCWLQDVDGIKQFENNYYARYVLVRIAGMNLSRE